MYRSKTAERNLPMRSKSYKFVIVYVYVLTKTKKKHDIKKQKKYFKNIFKT